MQFDIIRPYLNDPQISEFCFYDDEKVLEANPSRIIDYGYGFVSFVFFDDFVIATCAFIKRNVAFQSCERALATLDKGTLVYTSINEKNKKMRVLAGALGFERLEQKDTFGNPIYEYVRS